MATNPVDDQSYTYTADLLSGPLFFGALGYGADRWIVGAGNRWVIAGLILGIVMGLYAVLIRYRRSMAAIEAEERERRQAIRDAQSSPDPIPSQRFTVRDRQDGVGIDQRD